MKHANFETLIEHFEGKLSVGERAKVSEHLLICGVCTAQTKKLENFFGYVKMPGLEIIPQATTANLLNIYASPKVVKRESFVKKLLATLSFDDWQFSLNERFILSDTRQLLYTAEKFDIDLRLNFGGDKCRINGQVFPDCRDATIRIFSEDFSETALLNNDCEFEFPPIPNGIYSLRITIQETIIEIKNISLLI